MGIDLVKLIDPIQLVIAGTFNPMGAYDNATDYAVGDAVSYLGGSYIMYSNATAGTLPTDATKWQVLAVKGDTGAAGANGSNGANGSDGADGVNGTDGDDGAAATITVGTVTTVDPGDPATITNVGTANAAVFNFEIPQGEDGASSTPGGANTQVQFNDSGVFGGDAGLLFDKTTGILSVKQNIYFTQLGNPDPHTISAPDQATADTLGNGINIVAGGGNGTGDGGELNIYPGQGGETGNGGSFRIESGVGGATSGNGGDITLLSGTAQAGDGDAGDVLIATGNAHGSGTPGHLLFRNTATGQTGELNFAGLSAPHVYTFPDADGTIALTSDITDGVVATGASGVITLNADTDGGDFNLFSDTAGTLALYKAGAGVLDLDLLDGDLKTGSTIRLTNAGALTNITDLNDFTLSGADITGDNYYLNNGAGLQTRNAYSWTAGYPGNVGAGFEAYNYSDPVDGRGGVFAILYGGASHGDIRGIEYDGGYKYRFQITSNGYLRLGGNSSPVTPTNAIQLGPMNQTIASEGATNITLAPAGGTVIVSGGVKYNARVTTITSSGTPTINTDNCDAVTITAQAAAITSMTTNLSGTPTNFQKLMFRIKDDGTARAITWGASFEAKGVALPTTTVISKVLTVGFIYDTVTSKWGCVASVQEL